MSLAVGQTLTHYEILGPLGAGGMGEVYRARDTRLEREVAIKVLPGSFAGDEERLHRFQREAKALASLNHPNVAGIHGVDRDGDVYFLALELVPGEDLATRIARGRLPLEEALDVCRQIAEGLEAAHEAGVVHRDLKPANVRVTPEGEVKLLDFGLAKPIQPRATRDGATTAESSSLLVTEEGVVLGTPTYMSPEQARGKPVDRRTDVWALGCVLYECLTGKRPFGGESLTDVLAAIVGEEPDWSRLPALPERARELLRRMLTKDPRSRLRDVGEARVQLELAAGEPAVFAAGAPKRGFLPLALGSAVGLGGVLVGWWLRPEAVPPPPSFADGPRLAVELCVPVHDVEEEDGIADVRISPDATRVAWLDATGLHVRELGDPEPRTIAKRADVRAFTWSPDGEEVAYVADDSLWRIAMEASVPTRVAKYDGWFWSSLAWTPDDRIAYLAATGVACRTLDGERGTILPFEDAEVSHIDGFQLLRGGEAVVLVPHYAARNRITIELVHGGEREVITELPVEPGFLLLAGDRRLYWEIGEALWCATISRDLEVGKPRVVDDHWDRLFPSTAANGTLAALQPAGEVIFELVSIDRRDGTAAPIEGRLPGVWGPGDFSPDGSHFAFSVVSGKLCEIWLHDFERGSHSPVIQRDDGPSLARYLPDGRLGVTPLFPMLGTHVYAASGKGEPEHAEGFLLWESTEREQRVVVEDPHASLGEGVTYLVGEDVEGGRATLLEGKHGEIFLDVSPDESWMLHMSRRTGRYEAFLTRFPPDDGEWPLSVEGAEGAWFSAGGSEVYFVHEHGIYRVSIERDRTPFPGVPEHLFDVPADLFGLDYDGRDRFLGARRTVRGKVVYDTRGLPFR